MAIEARRMDRMVESVAHVFAWVQGGPWERHRLDPDVADFTFGNPQELPLPGLVEALQRHSVPLDKEPPGPGGARFAYVSLRHRLTDAKGRSVFCVGEDQLIERD